MKVNYIYWTCFSSSIKHTLTDHCGKEYAKKHMPTVKKEYMALMSQFPDIGNHTLTDMVPLACLFLAVWMGTEKRFTTRELSVINEDILKGMKWLFGLVNLNQPWGMKKLRNETQTYMKWLKKYGADYPDKWEGYINENSHEKGLCYVFTKCPVKDFCEKHNCLDILPALCSQDFIMYEMMHGILERNTTLADGNCCDFWIYGNKE